jgi:hypothetical protein
MNLSWQASNVICWKWSGFGFCRPRRSGGGACGGGPGSVDVGDLAVEAVLVQIAAGRLDPARGSYAPAFQGSNPAARISRSTVFSASSSSVA